MQTAGLICDKAYRAELTDLLLSAGVTRVTQAGNMSAYFFGESHDGEYPLSRYTRKINIELNNQTEETNI
ncbi:MAG: acyl-CoA reductase [[Eubacterium] siraeum]